MPRKLYALAALAIPSLGYACDHFSADECRAKSQRPPTASVAVKETQIGKRSSNDQRLEPHSVELRCHQHGVTIVQEAVTATSPLPNTAMEIGARADGRTVHLWSIGGATCLLLTGSSAPQAKASMLPFVSALVED